jgi:hypothetical protein
MAYDNDYKMFEYMEKLNDRQLVFIIKSLVAAGHVQGYIIGKAIDLAETIKL